MGFSEHVYYTCFGLVIILASPREQLRGFFCRLVFFYLACGEMSLLLCW